MSVRNSIILVLVMLVGLFIVGCSSGGTTPAQNGGTPDNNTETARISGMASENGVPVSGLEVAAYDVTDGSLVANDTTDSNGVYELNPLGGQYIIIAAGETGYVEPQYINLANDGTKHQLNLNMHRYQNQNMNGFMFCRVMNEDNDTPIPNARVRLDNFEGRTDAYGFCFITELPVQTTYQFRIDSGGFNGRVHEIRRNQTFDRNIILRAEYFKLTPTSSIGASIGGVVRDIATGEDLGGVFVTIEKPNTGFQPLTYMTNLGGVYRFYNLEKGTYVITATRTGYLEDSTQLIINDQEGHFKIFLIPNVSEMSSLMGTVFDKTGMMPIPNVTVTISNPLFGQKAQTVTDGLGKFTFAGLVYGDYYVFASPINPLFRPQGVPLTLTEEIHEVQFNLNFNESGAIMGVLTAVNTEYDPPLSKPVVGAKIIAEKIGAPMSGLIFETNSDGYGKYAINGVLPGTYLLKMSFEFSGDTMYERVEENVPVNAGAATPIDFNDLPWLQ